MFSFRRRILPPLILIGIVVAIGVALYSLEHPENKLIGTWREVAWTYEKADAAAKSDTNFVKLDLDEEMKNNIAQDLVIHQSETWTFSSNSALYLQKKNDNPVKLKWRLKGRGHILKLAYKDDTREFYQLKELTDDRMVLHFENDLHTRGIVKIVFEKIRS
jgi:hypothetical protein